MERGEGVVGGQGPTAAALIPETEKEFERLNRALGAALPQSNRFRTRRRRCRALGRGRQPASTRRHRHLGGRGQTRPDDRGGHSSHPAPDRRFRRSSVVAGAEGAQSGDPARVARRHHHAGLVAGPSGRRLPTHHRTGAGFSEAPGRRTVAREPKRPGRRGARARAASWYRARRGGDPGTSPRHVLCPSRCIVGAASPHPPRYRTSGTRFPDRTAADDRGGSHPSPRRDCRTVPVGWRDRGRRGEDFGTCRASALRPRSSGSPPRQPAPGNLPRAGPAPRRFRPLRDRTHRRVGRSVSARASNAVAPRPGGARSAGRKLEGAAAAGVHLHAARLFRKESLGRDPARPARPHDHRQMDPTGEPDGIGQRAPPSAGNHSTSCSPGRIR